MFSFGQNPPPAGFRGGVDEKIQKGRKNRVDSQKFGAYNPLNNEGGAPLAPTSSPFCFSQRAALSDTRYG